MATQRQEMALRDQAFNFTPTTLAEAQEYAKIFATSGICPAAYKGRPNDVLIIWQMGQELGLGKMQALRTIGCINGVPFAWGDGLLALVKRHSEFEDMHEWTEGSLKEKSLVAFCKIKRKNQEPVTQSFSIEDAQRAGLWNKTGPWQQYPARMLQHRARGFAARDAFPDALYGLMSEEEAVNSQRKNSPANITVKGKGMSGLEEKLGVVDGQYEIVTEIQGIDSEKIIIDSIHVDCPMISELKKLVDETQTDVSSWLEKANVTSLDDMSDEQVLQGINFLKNKLKENENGI